jgi:hypothetical protein
MRISWIRAVFLFLALITLGNKIAIAQTDVALSLYGAFNGTSNGNGTVQSPANAAGGMIEVRHISNPLIGYEGTYSYNRANQVYKASGYVCPVGLVPPLRRAYAGFRLRQRARDFRRLGGLFAVGSSPALRARGRRASVRCPQWQPKLDRHRDEADIHLWCGARLGPGAASRAALSISRQPLQGARPDAALYIDRRVYAHGRADDWRVFPFLKNGQARAQFLCAAARAQLFT